MYNFSFQSLKKNCFDHFKCHLALGAVVLEGSNKMSVLFLITHTLSTKNKLAFSLGHVLNDMCACIGVTYELVFFHKVLQLSNMYSGLLVLIGQVADGLSTMFVGIFSDRG